MPAPADPLVRELDLNDAEIAAAVHQAGRRAYAVEAGIIGFDGIPALRESLQDMRARPLRWLGAITDDGRVAAFVAWQTRAGTGPQVTWIDRVCVDPAFFRRGLATRLLRHLLTEVLDGGEVRVGTGAANRPATALYSGLGFHRTADSEPEPGFRMANFVLRLGTGRPTDG
ncbi:GNAT family N-acetyltransferase [Streptomyces sp. UNOB3_S3]|uniref:GNAT family N-acetyltransferase n=1 Tax=Streptomyces sp. UNOB3_S3 TaxID=2871682 RepID=UPI001E2A0679|nr:GNAT family N-acetyltransferase [Streptomyces sp. UNOB3_S3]MCC3779968.1 GNAT family N-acetyltransferase [Streptomyces sp. UNOB3_S3]